MRDFLKKLEIRIRIFIKFGKIIKSVKLTKDYDTIYIDGVLTGYYKNGFNTMLETFETD